MILFKINLQSISARLYTGKNPQLMPGSVIDEPGGKRHPHPVGHSEGPGVVHVDGDIDLLFTGFFDQSHTLLRPNPALAASSARGVDPEKSGWIS